MPLGGSVVSVAELWLRQTALFSVACALTFLQTEALILSSEKKHVVLFDCIKYVTMFYFCDKRSDTEERWNAKKIHMTDLLSTVTMTFKF